MCKVFFSLHLYIYNTPTVKRELIENVPGFILVKSINKLA